jgi:hypothetical protein
MRRALCLEKAQNGKESLPGTNMSEEDISSIFRMEIGNR